MCKVIKRIINFICCKTRANIDIPIKLPKTKSSIDVKDIK